MSTKNPIEPTNPKGVVSVKRVSGKMKAVIEEMVTKGVSLRTAADTIPMHYNAAKRAWRQPHVKAYYNSMVKDIVDGSAQTAFLRMNHLSETAKSESNKIDASKWVAGVGGISPLKKVQGSHTHHHSFTGFAYDDEEGEQGAIVDHASTAIEDQTTDNTD